MVSKLLNFDFSQAGVLVSPLASLTESVHPRLALSAPGKELDLLASEVNPGVELKPPVEALLTNLPVLSLPSHLVHQARTLVFVFNF